MRPPPGAADALGTANRPTRRTAPPFHHAHPTGDTHAHAHPRRHPRGAHRRRPRRRYGAHRAGRRRAPGGRTAQVPRGL
ncbi:hypothetical protein B7767_40445, partial [Streptomyces sp. 13-12-16]